MTYTFSHATMFYGSSAYDLGKGLFEKINPEGPDATLEVAMALNRCNPALGVGGYLARMKVEDMGEITVDTVERDPALTLEVKAKARTTYPNGVIAAARRAFVGDGFCVTYLKS